jgi:hypothetical protein
MLGDCKIPKGVELVNNFRAMGMDPNIFKNPGKMIFFAEFNFFPSHSSSILIFTFRAVYPRTTYQRPCTLR